MEMFSNISNLLNNLDNAAKETLEEPKESATLIRSRRKGDSNTKLASEDADDAVSNIPQDVVIANLSEDSEGQTERPEKAGQQSADLKKKLKAQRKEIEKLNAEILELEETVSSMRKEITDAWETYKQAQERAAGREADLQDEINNITKAKATDKQQLQAQLSKAAEDVNEAMRLMKAAHAERDSAITQLQEFQKDIDTWKAREETLLAELAQARAGSVLGAQDLLESLANAEKTMHHMRSEHSSLLKQSQVRQHEMERNITELTNSLTDKEKEITRLQMLLQQAGRDEASTKELDLLRGQVSNLIQQLDDRNDRYTTLERRTKALESELRANLLNFQDERDRAKELTSSLESKIVSLEESLKAEVKKRSSSRSGGARSGAESDAGSTGDWEVIGERENSQQQRDREDPNNALAKALDQIQQLSAQLLKKQGLAQELQAEKAALKSRVLDLQSRCARAEQQLTALVDAEADDFGDDDDEGKGKLQQRRNSKGKPEPKVIKDLEKIGVKAGPGVANTINLIDSWTLTIGRILRAYPLVRLFFALYLIIMHLMVFFVLAMHIHNVEMDSGPPVVNNRVRFNSAAATASKLMPAGMVSS